MKKTNRIRALISGCILCLLSNSVFSIQLLQSENSTPDVTFDRVKDVFGFNLSTKDTTLRNLLLAVSMDHTSTNSPNVNQDIGIPFIVNNGPRYWIDRLKSGENDLDVVVNNALLLLFTKEDIPGGKETAFLLMKKAADAGYWPAEYFVADTNLTSKLMTKDKNRASAPTRIKTSDEISLARDTMNKLNRCAEVGFAPCQYRIGFWLANSQVTVKHSITVLRKAIDTTLSDLRYEGSLDGALIKAAEIVVFNGEMVGLDKEIRNVYVDLITNKLNAISKETRKIERRLGSS